MITLTNPQIFSKFNALDEDSKKQTFGTIERLRKEGAEFRGKVVAATKKSAADDNMTRFIPFAYAVLYTQPGATNKCWECGRETLAYDWHDGECPCCGT